MMLASVLMPNSTITTHFLGAFNQAVENGLVQTDKNSRDGNGKDELIHRLMFLRGRCPPRRI